MPETDVDISEETTEEEPEEAERIRRGKGGLESDVKYITDAYAKRDPRVALEEGQTLTPHRIGKFIVTLLGAPEAPSTGAISACLLRWVDYGVCTTHEKPFAFADYTEEARSLGLSKLKEQFSARRKADKLAEKAAIAETPEASEAPVDEEASEATTEITTDPAYGE